jgi:DNA polymerase-1
MNKYQKLFNQIKLEQSTLPVDANDHVLLFDGLNTFIRSFGATPSVNEDGEHVGGITGFLYSIGKCVRDFRPSRCIIVFDGRGGSKRRKQLHTEYKANRANKTKLRRYDHHYASIDDEQEAMRHQFARLVSYLDALPVTFLAIDGIEADDTIAYITSLYHDTCKKITIVSTDRDFYQLVSDKVQLWSPIKKKMYDVPAVIEEYKVHPHNYVLYRSFTGDASDNIEGVSGIGPKTLQKVLPELQLEQEFTLEALFDKAQINKDNKTFRTILESRNTLETNYQLMNIKLLNISATQLSTIRNIISAPIPMLNKVEFQRMFMQDKLWAVMKNLPDWLNNTWLSLNAFAQKTQK